MKCETFIFLHTTSVSELYYSKCAVQPRSTRQLYLLSETCYLERTKPHAFHNWKRLGPYTRLNGWIWQRMIIVECLRNFTTCSNLTCLSRSSCLALLLTWHLELARVDDCHGLGNLPGLGAHRLPRAWPRASRASRSLTRRRVGPTRRSRATVTTFLRVNRWTVCSRNVCEGAETMR